MIRRFLSDRLSVAWLAAVAVLVIAILLVPNEGAGTVALIVLALPVIGTTGALRIRDGRRDREQKRGYPRP